MCVPRDRAIDWIPRADEICPIGNACRDELEEVLEEWLTLSLARHLPIPPLDGVEIVVPQAS